MPKSDKGEFEGVKKSPYNFEYYDSSWESDFMEELEKDDSVVKWTKNHGIIIPYHDTDGKYRSFKPDFLLERDDGTIELVEIKGKHLLPQFKRKMEAAQEWCKARKISFRTLSRY